MMKQEFPELVPPNAYTGLFQTVTSIYTGLGAGVFRILKADPRRVYVDFQSLDGVATVILVYPAPIPNGFAGVAQNNLPLVYKYHDCPSVVQGEFYGAVDLGLRVFITESIFVG